MKTALTIAGFDPSSGAGVTADLMVFAAHGIYGTSAVTAITVQSTVGVRATHAVAAEILQETLACLHADLPPAGIKIGMLANAANVAAVRRYVETASVKVVLDPVLRSSSGRELLNREGIELMRATLVPLVDWITPNLEEISLLSDVPVRGRADLPDAARALKAQVERASGRRIGIIATGGHLDPPDDFVLTLDGEELWLPGERIVTRATHGTGCAFSSAFLSRLILGEAPLRAAALAKIYVAEAMRSATPVGEGATAMNFFHARRASV